MNKALAKYERRVTQTGSLLCVGLDSDIKKLPARFLQKKYPQFSFNKWIISQTHQYVSAYKPNTAFYESRGQRGWVELAMTMAYLREKHPQIFTICDAKRGDIGSTNEAYAQAIFDELGFDAVTLNPYVGREALAAFVDRKDKISIFLGKTSNPGAGEFQDLKVGQKKLWQVVARRIAKKWNQHDNCMLVVGATYPRELAAVRKIVGEMTLLVPGIGAQGGDLAKVLKNGLNTQGKGLIINSSRGVIFARDPNQITRQLRSRCVRMMPCDKR